MNTCTVIGRIGSDAILKDVGKTKMLSFPLANNVGFKKKDVEQKTIWFRCQLWGQAAQAANEKNFLTKGRQVIVIGEVDLNTYETKDGKTASSLILNVQEFELVGPTKEEQTDLGF